MHNSNKSNKIVNRATSQQLSKSFLQQNAHL